VLPKIGGGGDPTFWHRPENPLVSFLFYPLDGRLTPTVPEGGPSLWLLRAYHPLQRTPANTERWTTPHETSNYEYRDSSQSDSEKNYEGLEPVLYSQGTWSNCLTCEKCFRVAGWVIPCRTEKLTTKIENSSNRSSWVHTLCWLRSTKSSTQPGMWPSALR
jgi:hypothetical protein